MIEVKNSNVFLIGYHGGVTGLTCGGDSGSPLVFFNSVERRYVQVGIVSGGTCQSKTDPAIFAHIEDHQTLEFIKKQFLKHIPPTSVKAIEKLLTENKVLSRKLDDLQENVLKIMSLMARKYLSHIQEHSTVLQKR